MLTCMCVCSMLSMLCLLVVSVLCPEMDGGSTATARTRVDTALPQAVFEGKNIVIIPLGVALAKGELIARFPISYPHPLKLTSYGQCTRVRHS